MHIFTSKQRPFIRISVLQSHMRSTYPQQVDSSQNRVAKDVLPTAPSPRRMTSQSMCKNGGWLDNHCPLLTQELKSLTDSTSPQKDGNSFFRDSSWFYSEVPNFFGSKCITTLVWRLKKLPRHTGMSALNCTYSGSSSSSSSPSLRGSAVGHSTTWATGEVMIQRRHLKCVSTWNAREKTTSTWWSSDNHAILRLGN